MILGAFPKKASKPFGIYSFWKILLIDSCQIKHVVFHRNLSDDNFPQISKTFLRILTYFSIPVVWMVSILFFISSLPSLISTFLEIVPSSLTAIRITITFMLYKFFFNYLASSRYFYSSSVLLFSLNCLFKQQNPQVLFFLLMKNRSFGLI